MNTPQDELVDEICEHIEKVYAHHPDEFEYEPGGDIGHWSGYCGENHIKPSESDALLIKAYEVVSGNKLRRQSDEPPSFDDALAEQCAARERQEEARKLK